MQQYQKYNSRNYFSIESVLASEEQFRCTFLKDENHIGRLNAISVLLVIQLNIENIVLFAGFIEAGNTTSQIASGSSLQLPYWIAKVFAPYSRVVEVDLPKPFKKVYRYIIHTFKEVPTCET